MALVAHYPLNGDTNDYSGYGRVATHSVPVTYNDEGKIGKCRDSGDMTLPTGTMNSLEQSITFWLYNKEAISKTASVVQFMGGSPRDYALFTYPNNNDLHWDFRNESSVGMFDGVLSGVLENLKWTHVSVIKSPTNFKIYINGVLRSQKEYIGSITDTTLKPFPILHNHPYIRINDIRIYDHALSDKEVKELAKAKVLHYKFDEQDLTTKIVKDSSGFGNDGTVAAATAPTWSEDSPVGRGSMEFGGAKFITLPNMLGSDEQITVCAWFKSNGLGGSGYHIIFGGTEVELDVTSAGNARFGLIIDNARQVHNYSSGLADGKYHHICGVYDGSVKAVYADGVLVGSYPVVGKIKNNITRRVGVFGTQTNYHANGNISDVRIYATALSPEDILELYQTRASVDNEGNLFVQEIDEVTDTSKEVDSRGIARFKEFNEVGGENKMSIKNDGVVYVNEIMEA